MAAGETVTCTFTNTKQGSIVAVKDAQPERPAGLLLHGRRRALARELRARRRLRPDALEHAHLRERLRRAPATRSPRRCPSGWDQTSATCDDGSPPSNIDLAPGETVTCTFTNRKRGAIVVVEDSQPNDPQDFSFTAGGGLSPTSFQLDDDSDPTLSNTRTFANLVPGSGYSLAETVPGGWDQTSRHLRRRQLARQHHGRRRARPSPAPSRTASAARSWS